MSQMPISDAREHRGEVAGLARYAGQETIVTHLGAPVTVVISFEEYPAAQARPLRRPRCA
jgi:hypothetical protein